MTLRRILPTLLALFLLGGAALTFALTRSGGTTVQLGANGCPAGYASRDERMGELRRERASERAQEAGASGEKDGEDEGEGKDEVQAAIIAKGPECVTRRRPEPVSELMAIQANDNTRSTGGLSETLKPGAYRAAVASRNRIAKASGTLPGSAGSWDPVGEGPLINDDPRFTETAGLGLADVNGRISDFALGGGERVYAAVGEGGVYQSDDAGQTWRSIGDTLPTQAVGSVGYSPANGGTVIASTGDSVFGGGGTFAGLGVYRTTDGGTTWQHASGVPDGVIAFKVRVDPSNPNVVYAATGAGLFRSDDAGASFANVALPTGAGVPANEPNCTGVPAGTEGCFLANMVTDVVVQAPGGTTKAKGGRVLAAVGWRSADKRNKSRKYPDGFAESPNNGFYASDDGRPGTFKKLPGTGLDPTAKVGRVELGAADGPEQNHDVVYAIIEDAARFNGEPPGIDAPGSVPGVVTVFDGLYASTDFGQSFSQLADAKELQSPASGSALVGTFQTVGQYGPGIQSWYDEWIAPDPTRQDASGIPTRVLFGLEEIWQNDVLPRGVQDDTATFKVVGRYFGGKTCLALDNPAGTTCPTDREPREPAGKTTHPDQHAGIFLPRAGGGVRAIVGNDGGAYVQDNPAGQTDFSNNGWGRGANQGFHTLLPYTAEIAKDGTIYGGLQDNGELKIEPNGKQYSIYGGDGTFSAVDPDDSNTAYEAYVFNDIAKTTDGGKTFQDVPEPSDDGYQFVNPFVMDPLSAQHLLTAGNGVHETDDGGGSFTTVFDLGTQKKPGTTTDPSSGDPMNQVTGVDVRSLGRTAGGVVKKSADVPEYEGGFGTTPDPVSGTVGTGTFTPGSYDDHPFTIKPDESNASATIEISFDAADDYDLYVFRKEGNDEVQVGESATSNPTERVVLPSPKPGDYIVRVRNFAAAGTFKGKVTFVAAVSAPTGQETAGYVSYCGYCDALNDETRPVASGIATNVRPNGTVGKKLKPDNWHIAAAKGLPERYVTSVLIDPADPRTVYATVAGYSRRWLPVGVLGEDVDPTKGSVFKSTDAGETFRNISGNLPDQPANSVLVRDGQLLVGTDTGVYVSADTDGGNYELLGSGLPAAPVLSLRLKPKATATEPDLLVVATQGRGVYKYSFKDPQKSAPAGFVGGQAVTGPRACVSSAGFRSVGLKRSGRSRLKINFRRRASAPVTVDVFRVSQGRRIVKERLIARFRNKSRSFTWNGVSNRERKRRRVGTGYYFVRYTMTRGGKRIDTRRLVARKTSAGFSKRPDYSRRAFCDLLNRFKLERPAFGGTRLVTLKAAYRLRAQSRVTVTITRGSKVVKRYKAKVRQADRTYRISLPARRRPAGDYRVRLEAKPTGGGKGLRATLVSRRL